MIFTASAIDELVSCPKRITEAPAKEFKDENRHRRKDMRLLDTRDPKRAFIVFIRQSQEFAEDFSLRLVYLSPDRKRITLIRYSGQHDQSNDPYDLAKTHFQYHIHKATEENLNNGKLDKHPAGTTDEYTSFEQAIAAFLSVIGLRDEDVSAHFQGIIPLPLFRNMSNTP